MGDITKYVAETSYTQFNRNDIDNKIFKYDISNRAFIDINDDEFLNIGNRAFFSIAYDNGDNKLSLPLTSGGELFDVVVLSGGIYTKAKPTNEFSSIPTDKTSFVIDSTLYGYQGDAAVLLIYLDKTTQEIADIKKILLQDNTNQQMGNGNFICYPQFINSSCQVMLDTTSSIILSCCGLELDATVNPDSSADIKITSALDLSIDITSMELSNISYSFDVSTNEYVELETHYTPSARFGHGTIKIDDKSLIICGALDTSVLDFSNIPLFENTISTEILKSLESLLDDIEDTTISTGSFGMEEVLTGKVEDQDFGVDNTTGEDGQYALIPFTNSSDLSIIVVGWTTGTSLNNSVWAMGGCGNILGTLSFGGYYNLSETNLCEKWSVSSWATTTSMNETRAYLVGCGTVSAALAIGGEGASDYLSSVEQYNGSTWATTSQINQGKRMMAGCGTISNALIFGGRKAGGFVGTTILQTEKYNGSVQATTSNAIYLRDDRAGCGTSNDALSFGGGNQETEKQNGTIWATTSYLLSQRFALSGCGTTSGALSFGGLWGVAVNTTETWNGFIQATTTSLNTARKYLGGAGNKQNALAFGGTLSQGEDPIPSTERWFETETNIGLGDKLEEIWVEVAGGGVCECSINYPGDITSIYNQNNSSFPLKIDFSELDVYGEICLFLGLPNETKIKHIQVSFIPSLY